MISFRKRLEDTLVEIDWHLSILRDATKDISRLRRRIGRMIEDSYMDDQEDDDEADEADDDEADDDEADDDEADDDE